LSVLSKYNGDNFFVTAFNFQAVCPILTDTQIYANALDQCCQHMQLHEAVTLNQPICVSVQAMQTCCALNSRTVRNLGRTTQRERKVSLWDKN
jgi:hypothetical protein